MTVQGVATQDCGDPGRVGVAADILSDRRDDRGMED